MGMMRQTGYRTRQFLRALGERPDAETRRLAERFLTREQRRLFVALSPRDQRHSARTAALLLRQDYRDPELIQAALLHDVGKGRQALWQRVAYVLLAASSPRLLRRVARPGDGWRGALERSRRHAVLGAEAARRAGSPPRVVGLIRAHHDPSSEADASALAAADERS